jgi:type II secretion system protein N
MIEKIFSPIFSVLRNHKRKAAIFLLLYLVFLYFLFPFNDLGDLVAQKVSDATSGQVFVNFDTLDLNLFPEPGVALKNVTVETAFTPRLSAKLLTLAPSIAGLLSFKPGVNAHAESLFGGTVNLSTRGGEKSSQGKLKQKISLDLSKINLADLVDLAQLPMKLTGLLSGSLDSQLDLDFIDQPSADMNISMAKVQLPESSLNTPMGPFDLPKLALNDILLDGHADKGSIDVSKLSIGKPGGDFYATATGKFDCSFQKLGNNISPRPGAYDFTVRMQVGDEFKNKLGVYLGLLQSYSSGPNAYAFRITAANVYVPPTLSKIP